MLQIVIIALQLPCEAQYHVVVRWSHDC